jgi:hypothetical protein
MNCALVPHFKARIAASLVSAYVAVSGCTTCCVVLTLAGVPLHIISGCRFVVRLHGNKREWHLRQSHEMTAVAVIAIRIVPLSETAAFGSVGNTAFLGRYDFQVEGLGASLLYGGSNSSKQMPCCCHLTYLVRLSTVAEFCRVHTRPVEWQCNIRVDLWGWWSQAGTIRCWRWLFSGCSWASPKQR